MERERKGKSSLQMFMGSEGGILGVGAPEVAVTILVGYFLLGPSELYKLTKEIGKLFTSLRTLSSEATKSFESNMESQLELQELRKAQRELTDAFSFRRSINVDQEADPFQTRPNAPTGQQEDDFKPKKKVKKRRKKLLKRPSQNIDDDLTKPPPAINTPTNTMPPLDEMAPLQPLNDDWFSSPAVAPAASEEQARFAAQLSQDWNERILQNQDKLSPLSLIMQRLSILEQEKNAAQARLEEEFRLRADLEEKFYRDKRNLLQDAAIQLETFSSSSNYTLPNYYQNIHTNHTLYQNITSPSSSTEAHNKTKSIHTLWATTTNST